ncbi:heme oxygenase (biliverdin-producing) [Rothia kristinae]|uniref:biliverdin-producing heme oxygenase n=1 Tax=Rothia kristinae TaxID=37923 RepID=UPI000736148F|nr:biliverdin-producing heme oxygenase [Rothia kristinae]KTR37434.1 heme oxygenase [Rothia kristinae]KTR55634.1 heme oxygenase [Rothia kristinae]KTR64926.1 heme oxygenase [Rothia kristinae]KTR73854.1 heme oxygenase [Rothia kristinae]KTR79416.1 heme oxygenase [Rothia kristinae]
MSVTTAHRSRTDAAQEETFSARLRRSTAKRHSSAEHSTFMTDLMGGTLDASAYLRLLAQYRHIYAALEEVARSFREDPQPLTNPFVLPGLDRLSAIEADLAVLADLVGRPLDVDGDPLFAALLSTAEYVARIRTTRTSPERFLAHHYLRYLGDLSGGQAVAALMARHYGLPAEALSMYRFPDLPKPKVFKDGYRTLLDRAQFSEDQRAALVEEAVAGFDLNARMFADLQRAVRA